MELEELKSKICELLKSNLDMLYSMNELTKEFGQEKWLVQKAVSQLDDERKVQLKVRKKLVYVYCKE